MLQINRVSVPANCDWLSRHIYQSFLHTRQSNEFVSATQDRFLPFGQPTCNLHPSPQLDNMEAEAACDAEDKMHPMEPGPENSTLPQTALEVSCNCPLLLSLPANSFAQQPRPDDVATVSKIAARPASEV